MIFDTLAAMAEYNHNKKFDLTATTAQCKEIMVSKNAAGSFTMKSGSVTVDAARTYNVDDADKLKFFVQAMQTKTPLQVLSASMAPYA